MTNILVPGYKGSPEGHWQFWLRTEIPNTITVEQDSWDFPQMGDWVEKLQKAVAEISGPIRLIGHSMGSITISFWAKKYGSENVHSAILVAPAESEDLNFPKEMVDFSPIPTVTLPFHSTVIGSHNDPYMTFQRALYFANKWGSDFIDAGNAGHINID